MQYPPNTTFAFLSARALNKVVNTTSIPSNCSRPLSVTLAILFTMTDLSDLSILAGAGRWLFAGRRREHVVEEPVVEEPVVEEPVVEQPVVEEPVAEEPVAEEPVVEEDPAIEAPVVVVEPWLRIMRGHRRRRCARTVCSIGISSHYTI